MIDLAALEADGYTTVQLLDPAATAELAARYDDLGVDPTTAYWASSVHADRATARQIDLELKASLGPAVDEQLPDHEPFLAAFIAKGAQGGRVGLHPDWTYTDERAARARVVWVALVDTDERNGAMVVVPGSHLRLHGLRGSGDFPSPVERIEEELWEEAVRTVPLRAGEAIVWDAALVHGSWPNERSEARPAAAIAVAPAGAGLVHFHRRPDGRLEGWSIDEAFYTTLPYGEPPAGYPSLDPWDGPVQPLPTSP